MPTQAERARRIWNMLTIPGPERRKIFLKNVNEGKPVFTINGQEPIKLFSDFNNDHKARVELHLQQMLSITANEGNYEKGVDKALDHVDSLDGKENPDLLKYTLEVYLLENAKKLPVQKPSILVKEPELVVSSEHVLPRMRLEFATDTDEPKMDWFREDPLLNAHHTHWHQVYRDNQRDRHGEMFLYMHQQMIARYNTERIALELNEVNPYDDLHQPISIGYLAGPDGRLSLAIGGDRQPDAFVNPDLANGLLTQRERLSQAIDRGNFDINPAAPDSLREETRAASRLGWELESGYHNSGHGVIASINDGVMGATIFAIRDVVFWEWHKGIDNLGARWRQRLPAYNLGAESKPLRIRKSVDQQGKPFTPDLILSFLKDIPGIDEAGFNGEAVGNTAFGGNNWNTEFISGSLNFDNHGNQATIKYTDSLQTSMKSGTVKYRLNGQEKNYKYPYLAHEPFGYFLRLENKDLVQKQVTIRIFIVAEGKQEDRRMWIEMDKFLQELPPQSKVVAFRKDSEAAVIRKPAVLNPATENIDFDPTKIGDNNALCDCGWPYHLLVPRGTRAGMGFRIMMMVTDAAVDLVGPEPECGSLSFCGATSNLYPDKRPLGYPFNRKFNANGTAITNTIAATDNMGWRSITIKLV
ncbi:MAG: hypothetical protein ABIT05_06615 [Chitinophagaceae bacterium]